MTTSADWAQVVSVVGFSVMVFICILTSLRFFRYGSLVNAKRSIVCLMMIVTILMISAVMNRLALPPFNLWELATSAKITAAALWVAVFALVAALVRTQDV